MNPRWPGLVLSSAFALLAPGCAAPLSSCRLHAHYSNLCAEELANGNLEVAEAYCDQGMALYLEYGDLWYRKGLIYMVREDWGAARYFMSMALRYDSGHAGAHAQLGNLFLRDGDAQKAGESFSAALKWHPGLLDARYGLALALLKQGRAEEAFGQCSRMDEAQAACREGLEEARRGSPP